MIVYIYRQQQKRLGTVQKFAKLDSNGESGDTGDPEKSHLQPPLSNLHLSRLPQVRVRVATSAVPRPNPTSPQYVRGHTRFGSEGMMVPPDAIGTPVFPELINYRDSGAERPRRTPDPSQSPNTTRPAENRIPVPGSASDHLLPYTPRKLTQPDMDIDQILDVATMYSLTPTALSTVRTAPEHITIPSHTRVRARHDHPPRYGNRS